MAVCFNAKIFFFTLCMLKWNKMNISTVSLRCTWKRNHLRWLNRSYPTLLIYKLSSEKLGTGGCEREPGSHMITGYWWHTARKKPTLKRNDTSMFNIVSLCYNLFFFLWDLMKYRTVGDHDAFFCVCVWPLFIMCRKLSSCVYWELLIFHCLHFLSQNVSPTCLQNLSIMSRTVM